jgi:hypothetical protein
MNPSLTFAQGIPGRSTGRSTGIIDTVSMITLIQAIPSLEKSDAWEQKDDMALKEWFTEYVNWLQTSQNGIQESNATNNHGVWYDAQIATFSHFIGNDNLAVKTIQAAETKRINQQIQPDGSMPQEIARTRSMSYSLYNLEAFITLACVGDSVSVDLWDYSSADGRSIRNAIDLYPSVYHGEKHMEPSANYQ